MALQQAEKPVKQNFSAETTPRRFAMTPNTPLMRSSGNADLLPEKLSKISLQPRFVTLMLDQNDKPAKCFCSECRKTFDGNYDNASASKDGIPDPCDIACPECGIPQAGFIAVPVKSNDKLVWQLPTVILGGFTYEYKNAQTDAVERQDINIVSQQIDINVETGERTWLATEASTVINYANHNIQTTISTSNTIGPDGRMVWSEKNRQTLNNINPYKFTKSPKEDINNVRRMQSADNAVDSFPLYESMTSAGLGELKIPGITTEIMRTLKKKDVLTQVRPGAGSVKYGNIDAAIKKAKTYDRYKIGINLDAMSDTGFKRYSEANTELIKQTLAQRFEAMGVDPVYTDWEHNCLFCGGVIYPNSIASKSKADIHATERYLHLMIRYPAVFEYACERADAAIENDIYAEYRNAKEANNIETLNKYGACDMPNKTPEEREAKDAAMKKLVREYDPYKKAEKLKGQLDTLSNQLRACQPNVLDTISKSENAKSMKEQLQFYAFGDAKGTKRKNIDNTLIPSNIRGVTFDKDGNVKNNTGATNTLIASFEAEPITTANTCYVLYKIGIKDPDLRAQVIETAENAKNSFSGKALCKYGTIYVQLTNDAMSLIKNWINYDSADKDKKGNPDTYSGQKRVAEELFLKEQFYSNDEHNLMDAVEAWGKIRPQKDSKTIMNLDPREKKPDPNAYNSGNSLSDKLRNYLINSDVSPSETVRNAYRDFAHKIISANEDSLKNATNENKAEFVRKTINNAFNQIRRDHELTQLKQYYNEHGNNIAALTKHPALDKILSQYGSDDASKAAALEKYTPIDERTIFVEATDSKPIFQGRTLSQLHDEIVLISKKTGSNEKLKFTEEELQRVEGSYPLSAEDPDKKLSFRVMRDKFDYIKTSNVLHNCVASSDSYFNSCRTTDLKSRCYILVAEDELKNRVACIELHPYKDDNGDIRYKINQLEGTHDSKLDSKYAEAATAWMNDKKLIPRAPNFDEVTVFCEYNAESDQYIAKKNYDVNVNTNIHYDRYTLDPIENMSVEKGVFAVKQKTRREMADMLFGENNAPEPDIDCDIFAFDIEKAINSETPETDGTGGGSSLSISDEYVHSEAPAIY